MSRKEAEREKAKLIPYIILSLHGTAQHSKHSIYTYTNITFLTIYSFSLVGSKRASGHIRDLSRLISLPSSYLST